jgi:hypothetical protein
LITPIFCFDYKLGNSTLSNFLQPLVTSAKIFFSEFFSQTFSAHVLPLGQETKLQNHIQQHGKYFLYFKLELFWSVLEK